MTIKKKKYKFEVKVEEIYLKKISPSETLAPARGTATGKVIRDQSIG